MNRIVTLLLLCSYFAQAQQPYLAESFSNNEQQWPFLGQGEGYNISIENGHLVLNGNTTAIHTFKKVDVTADIDFSIYARMIFLNGDHTGWMGVRFMMNEGADKYYTFAINNDKGFLISEWNGKKYEAIRQSISQVVLPYDYNTLTVVKKGSVYKFLINDKQVHEAKIKSFFGPFVGLMTNSNMAMQVDEIQVYDPMEGRKKLNNSERISSLSTNSLSQNQISENNINASPEFQEFLSQFPSLAFPYYFHPENAQAVDISHLPFAQTTFYQYAVSSVRNRQVWAMGKLSECGEGLALLVMNRYQINDQDVSKFVVAIFDANGVLRQEKDIGMMVKEFGDFFKVIEFKVYRDANAMNIEATETFHNGNKIRNSVRYNTHLCN